MESSFRQFTETLKIKTKKLFLYKDIEKIILCHYIIEK